MSVPRAGVRDRRHARNVEAWLRDHPDHSERTAVAHELLCYDWRARNTQPLSDHLLLEAEAAHRRGQPLGAGKPVPACGCEDCTGIPEQTLPKNSPRQNPQYCPTPLPVERARGVSITEVAAQLGLEANGHGWALCPFHADSDPSLHVNEAKQAAFCNVCGESWDGIALLMDMENLEFHEAVKEIAGWTGWREGS